MRVEDVRIVDNYSLPNKPVQKHHRIKQSSIIGIVVLLSCCIAVCFWLIFNEMFDRAMIAGAVLLYAFAVALLLLKSVPHVLQGKRIGYFMMLFGSWFFFAYPAVKVVLDPYVWFGDRARFALSNEYILYTVIYLTLFLLTAILSYEFFSRRPLTINGNTVPVNPRHLLAPLIVLFVLVALPYLILGGGFEETIRGILASRSGAASKGWKQSVLLGDHISPIWVFSRASLTVLTSFSLLMLLKFQPKGLVRWFYIGIFLLNLTVLLFDTGTRSWLVLAVVPPIAVFFQNKIKVSKYTFGQIMIAGILASLVLAIGQFQLHYRTVGNFSELNISISDVFTINDNDFFNETAVAVSAVPRLHNFVRENTFGLFVSNIIPRFLWSNKPLPETVHLHTLIRRGYDPFQRSGGNSMPSVVGQFYMSWGFWGVLMIGMFYGFLYGLLDRRLQISEDSFWKVAYLTVMIWLWIGHRGLYPGFHYAFVVQLGMLWWVALSRKFNSS